jgi:hypothetical protein
MKERVYSVIVGAVFAMLAVWSAERGNWYGFAWWVICAADTFGQQFKAGKT